MNEQTQSLIRTVAKMLGMVVATLGFGAPEDAELWESLGAGIIGVGISAVGIYASYKSHKDS